MGNPIPNVACPGACLDALTTDTLSLPSTALGQGTFTHTETSTQTATIIAVL
jgi:hypothetical protein